MTEHDIHRCLLFGPSWIKIDQIKEQGFADHENKHIDSQVDSQTDTDPERQTGIPKEKR